MGDCKCESSWFFSHGFIPVIYKPTRIITSSATLIDHMYSNIITLSHYSGIIINHVIDHFGTFPSKVNASLQTSYMPQSQTHSSFLGPVAPSEDDDD